MAKKTLDMGFLLTSIVHNLPDITNPEYPESPDITNPESPDITNPDYAQSTGYHKSGIQSLYRISQIRIKLKIPDITNPY